MTCVVLCSTCVQFVFYLCSTYVHLCSTVVYLCSLVFYLHSPVFHLCSNCVVFQTPSSFKAGFHPLSSAGVSSDKACDYGQR